MLPLKYINSYLLPTSGWVGLLLMRPFTAENTGEHELEYWHHMACDGNSNNQDFFLHQLWQDSTAWSAYTVRQYLISGVQQVDSTSHFSMSR